MIYEWKPGARIRGMDAQKVGERLEKIRSKQGAVTPKAVVKEARKKTSPLHNGFEWDVRKAAQAHWEETARSIIRSVVVTVTHDESGPRKTRAFVHIGEPEEYEDIHTILSVPAKRESLLSMALAELNRARIKYGDIEELTAVWEAMDRVAA